MAEKPVTYQDLYAQFPGIERTVFEMERAGTEPAEAELTLLRRAYRKLNKAGNTPENRAKLGKVLGLDEAGLSKALKRFQSVRGKQVETQEGLPEQPVTNDTSGFNPLDAGAYSQANKIATGQSGIPDWTFIPQLFSAAGAASQQSAAAVNKVGEAGGLIGEAASLGKSKRTLELGIDPRTGQPLNLEAMSPEERQELQTFITREADRTSRLGMVPSAMLPLPVGQTPGEIFAEKKGPNREDEIFSFREQLGLGAGTAAASIFDVGTVAGVAGSAGRAAKTRIPRAVRPAQGFAETLEGLDLNALGRQGAPAPILPTRPQLPIPRVVDNQGVIQDPGAITAPRPPAPAPFLDRGMMRQMDTPRGAPVGAPIDSDMPTLAKPITPEVATREQGLSRLQNIDTLPEGPESGFMLFHPKDKAQKGGPLFSPARMEAVRREMARQRSGQVITNAPVPKGQELGPFDAGKAAHFANAQRAGRMPGLTPEQQSVAFSMQRGRKAKGKKKSVGAGGPDDMGTPDIYGPLKDKQFQPATFNEGGPVIEVPNRGVPYHTARPTDIPRSQSLAKVPGNQVVDSTRYVEENISHFPTLPENIQTPGGGAAYARAMQLAQNTPAVFRRPMDAQGNAMGTLNLDAFPDRLPMGDRQGELVRPTNRYGEELDTGKMRERERLAQRDLTYAKEVLEEKPFASASNVAARRENQEIARLATNDETPALSDLAKRFLKDEEGKAAIGGLTNKIGAPLAKRVNNFANGLKEIYRVKKAIGSKDVQMALDKFIGRKAVFFADIKAIAPELVERAVKRGAPEKQARAEVIAWAKKAVGDEIRSARKELLATAKKAGVPESEADALSRELVEFSGNSAKWAKKFVRYIKTSKVLWNPLTNVVNNLMGNEVFAIASGGHRNLKKAGGELLKKGDHYQRAMSDGLFGSEFFAHTTDDFLKDLERGVGAEDYVDMAAKWLRKGLVDAPAFIYDGTDKVYKLSAYISKFDELVAKGVSQEVASREAVHHVGLFFPNYEKLSGVPATLRKSSLAPFAFNPFIAFPTEAARIYKNWLTKGGARQRTVAAALPLYLLGAYNYGALMNLEGEDVASAREDLPGYQNFGGRFNIPLGRDAEGEMRFLDITNWIPLLDLFSGSSIDKTRGPIGKAAGMATQALKRFAFEGLLTSPDYQKPGQPKFGEALSNLVTAPSRGTALDLTRTKPGQLLTPPVIQRALGFGLPRSGEEEGDPIRDALAAFGVRLTSTSDVTRDQADRFAQGQERSIENAASYIENNMKIPEEDKDALIEDILRRYENLE